MSFPRRAIRIRRPADRSGAAAVEFAMTVPILFLLLFSSVELSRMNMIRQTANNAAYEASRKCTVPGATAADGRAAATSILQAVGIRGATVDVQPDPIVNTTPQVTATVTVPYSSNMWVMPVLSKNGSVTMRCQLTRDWVVSTRQGGL